MISPHSGACKGWMQPQRRAGPAGTHGPSEQQGASPEDWLFAQNLALAPVVHCGRQPTDVGVSFTIRDMRGAQRRDMKSTRSSWQAAMQLARLWREHMAAGCPRELTGVEIAGADARELDAEINACVSALLCRSLTVDGRIERRLVDISTALTGKQAEAGAPIAAYCARLNQLVSAVLSETRGGRA